MFPLCIACPLRTGPSETGHRDMVGVGSQRHDADLQNLCTAMLCMACAIPHA